MSDKRDELVYNVHKIVEFHAKGGAFPYAQTKQIISLCMEQARVLAVEAATKGMRDCGHVHGRVIEAINKALTNPHTEQEG